jgi:hypothetical protein
MKQISVLLTLMLASSFCLHAQDNFPWSKNPPRRAFIEFIGGDSSKGFIRSLDDSTLLFAKRKSALSDLRRIHPEVQVIPYRDIDILRVHRLGSTWKGIGIGAVAGAIAGAIIGAATYQAPPPPTNWNQVFIEIVDNKQIAILGGTVLGTFTGIVVGAIVGAVAHKKFIIQGKKDRFRQMQKRARIIP